MKLTQSQLRRIIKEELKNALNEAGNDEMEAVEATADAFRKSPQMMALVDQALENPEVIAALEQATSQEELAEISNLKKAKIAGGVAKAGAGVGIPGAAWAVGATPSMLALKAIVGPIVGMNAVALTGITVGLPAMALGFAVYLEFSRRQGEYQAKAEKYYETE